MSGDPVATPLLPLGFSPPQVLGSREGNGVSAVASGSSRCLGLTFTVSNMLMRSSLQFHFKPPGPEMLLTPPSAVSSVGRGGKTVQSSPSLGD